MAPHPSFMLKHPVKLTLPLIVLTALLTTATFAADAAPPNVLLIVCDDLNTHVGPGGYAPIKTPAAIFGWRSPNSLPVPPSVT